MRTTSIGRAVQQRRAAFELSQEEVASLAGLPVAAVRSVEEDDYAPTAYELARLAEALAVDPAALWRGDAPFDDAARGTVRFLAGSTMEGLSGRDHRMLARAAEVGRVGRFLWRLLGRHETPLMRAQTVTPMSWASEPWRQGYELGEGARQAFADTRRPLDSVQRLLEDMGVHVAFVDFEADDVIGASLSEPDALPVILLNRRHSRVKYVLARRSVLAHELCHVLHDATERHIVSVVSRASQQDEPVEQRANGFAPSFLAPPSWVEARGADPASIVRDLATTWMLSWEGACWHAKNLQLIPPAIAESLRAPPRWRASAASDEAVLSRTPLGMLGIDAEPTLLVDGLVSELIAQAVSEGEIARGRAAEILSIR